MSFEDFKKQVNNVVYNDGNFKEGINLLIKRYGLNKVDYYFNQINIFRKDQLNYVRMQYNDAPLNFEIIDVMEHCEYL